MRLPIAPVIGGIAFGLMPPDILRGDPSKLLMPFLGLFMAGIFPAISLTINSLKAGGFSVKRIRDMAVELSKLLGYLQALFAVALTAALILVAAEALKWGEHFYAPQYSSRMFNVVLGGCLGILATAMPKLRRTLATLLNITREIAEDEAASKLKERANKLPSIVDRYPTKEKFGELFQADKLLPPT
jgi:hypothetical protein